MGNIKNEEIEKLIEHLEFAKNCEIDFKVLRENNLNFKCYDKFHQHKYYELKIDLTNIQDNKVNTLMVLPNVLHRFTTGHIIFNCNQLCAFIDYYCWGEKNSLNIPVIKYGGNFCNDLLKILDKIPEQNVFLIFRQKILLNLFDAIITILKLIIKDGFDDNSCATIIEKTIFFMERNYHDRELSISQIAEDLNISQQHLMSCFTKELNISPRKKLIQIRLEHAMMLLQNGQYLIKEVAEMCGWQNQFYFCNCFRKRYGISPSEVIK